MEYVRFNQKYEYEIVRLWNKCCTFDPICIERFRKQALYDDNFDCDLCWIALDDKKPVGFVLATKRKVPFLERGLEPDKGWINVIFVDPEYQNRGIGERLYGIVEAKLKKLGVRTIILAAYSPNYFFGGVDEINYPEAASFFLKMGYKRGEHHYSMGKDISEFSYSQQVIEKKETAEKEGYRFIHFKNEYSIELLEFLKREFDSGWKRNALIAMKKGIAEDVILLMVNKENSICGFSMSAIDDNPKRFGPIGVAKSIRDKGYGSVLLEYSLNEMKERGIDNIFFMTTDERGKNFYERNGFYTIRNMVGYSKNI